MTDIKAILQETTKGKSPQRTREQESRDLRNASTETSTTEGEKANKDQKFWFPGERRECLVGGKNPEAQGLVDGAVSLEEPETANKPTKRGKVSTRVSEVCKLEETTVGTWVVTTRVNRPDRAQQEDDPHGLQTYGPKRTSKQDDPHGLLTRRPEMGTRKGRRPHTNTMITFSTTMNLFLTRGLDPCAKVDLTVPVRVRADAINGRPGGRSGFFPEGSREFIGS
jgi:hypothetical protein